MTSIAAGNTSASAGERVAVTTTGVNELASPPGTGNGVWACSKPGSNSSASRCDVRKPARQRPGPPTWEPVVGPGITPSARSAPAPLPRREIGVQCWKRGMDRRIGWMDDMGRFPE
jgi:hypothetical protein